MHLEDASPVEEAGAAASSNSVDVQLRRLYGHPCNTRFWLKLL